MLKMLDLHHRCAPYCKPELGEHTKLVYGTNDDTEENFQEMIMLWRGGEIIRFVEEPNAPPRMNETSFYPKAWYVTWRTR